MRINPGSRADDNFDSPQDKRVKIVGRENPRDGSFEIAAVEGQYEKGDKGNGKKKSKKGGKKGGNGKKTVAEKKAPDLEDPNEEHDIKADFIEALFEYAERLVSSHYRAYWWNKTDDCKVDGGPDHIYWTRSVLKNIDESHSLSDAVLAVGEICDDNKMRFESKLYQSEQRYAAKSLYNHEYEKDELEFMQDFADATTFRRQDELLEQYAEKVISYRAQQEDAELHELIAGNSGSNTPEEDYDTPAGNYDSGTYDAADVADAEEPEGPVQLELLETGRLVEEAWEDARADDYLQDDDGISLGRYRIFDKDDDTE